jgi:hypothetical protein
MQQGMLEWWEYGKVNRRWFQDVKVLERTGSLTSPQKANGSVVLIATGLTDKNLYLVDEAAHRHLRSYRARWMKAVEPYFLGAVGGALAVEAYVLVLCYFG